jgi:sec-independent protein translocase protein TatC
MRSNEEEQGVRTPDERSTPNGSESTEPLEVSDAPPAPASEPEPAESPSYATSDDYGYGYGSDEPSSDQPAAVTEAPATEVKASEPPPPTPPETAEEEEDADDDGMLRMSFLEHLEELRSRILKALMGIGVAFLVSLTFAETLWIYVSSPATTALLSLGFKEAKLAQITPMETFSVVWVKLPMLSAIFLAFPWVIIQVWGFIAPGLYKRERRWARPFVLCSVGLFYLGGLFAYFVAFRFGLTFLLGIGRDINILPLVSVSEYFSLFVNVMLGVGVIFELPVVIFFLTLLRITSPGFLLRNARYAILVIVLLAAIITPTPDIFNLMIFSVPMVLLFFVGVFASYLLVLSRENRRFPWGVFLLAIAIPLLLVAGGVYLAIAKYGYHLVLHWPFLVR